MYVTLFSLWDCDELIPYGGMPFVWEGFVPLMYFRNKGARPMDFGWGFRSTDSFLPEVYKTFFMWRGNVLQSISTPMHIYS